MAALDEQDRKKIAEMPAARRAECQAFASKTEAETPVDCGNLLWAAFAGNRAVPKGWQVQLENPPVSLWRAVAMTLPWAGGPPLLLLAFGVAFSWVFVGFRRA
jgi:hypothetical protein